MPKTGTVWAFHFISNADALDDAGRLGLYHLARSSRWTCRAARTCSRRLRNWGIINSGLLGRWRQHTPYCRLGPVLRLLPILTILREPLSWHLSFYHQLVLRQGELGRRKLLGGLRSTEPSVRAAYQSFVEKHLGGEVNPETWRRLSLEGYWRYVQDFQIREVTRPSGIAVSDWLYIQDSRKRKDFPLGFLGRLALKYLHSDPERIFAMQPGQAEEYFADGRWRRDLGNIRFLRHERLREDLYAEMLESLGYRRETLDDALKLTPERMNRADAGQRERALRELEQKPWLSEEILRNEKIYAEHFLPLAGERSEN